MMKILRYIKEKFSKSSVSIRDEKRKVVVQYMKDNAIKWQDFEDLMFWKDPLISLTVYLLFSALCWKFIIFEFQRLALAIVVTSIPLLIKELRLMIYNYMVENNIINPKVKLKKLPFDIEDVYDIVTDIWVLGDENYNHLLMLKSKSPPKFTVWIVSYISVLIVIIVFTPVVDFIFFTGTIMYLYPVLNYLGAFDIVINKFFKLAQPIIVHWGNSQTKRKRNLPKRRSIKPASKMNISCSSEDEMFIPEKTHLTEKLLFGALPGDSNSSHGDSFDELDLQSHLYNSKRGEDGHASSDFDEDAFIPSSFHGPSDPMPSLSQFDSMMEPFDDEFHAGLDFPNASAVSVHYRDSDDILGTDEEIEDLPIENNDENDFYIENERTIHEELSNSALQNNQKFNLGKSNNNGISNGGDDGSYEFLDESELLDVSEDEINKQNYAGKNNNSEEKDSESNVLGY